MFLEHNASYVFPNEETILHVIMRKKFRNLAKKKMFLKEVREKEAYRSCVLQKDQRGKVALDYEEDPDIRAYYVELFKEKVKPAEKEKNAAVPKTKEKEFFK